jgi:hypothetical protein
MQVMNQEFRFDNVDVIVNRNSLRKLLDLCQGSCSESFRIKLFMVHNTLVIERSEKSAQIMLRGSGNSGYGHNFKRACTQLSPELSDSSGHHRVLKYNLGNLCCAVRFEVDAVSTDLSDQNRSRTEPDDLAAHLGTLQLAPSPSKSKASQRGSVQVIPRGTITAQSQSMEIKTRSKPSPISKFLPQLWFGRTPYLARAYHVNGTFQRCTVKKCLKDFEEWEQTPKIQLALQKMVSVISQLRDITNKTPGKACIAICERCDKPLKLKVFAAKEATKALPEAVITKFWVGKAGK